MAALTTTALTESGSGDLVAALTAAAAGGDSFVWDSQTAFVINNGGGGSITVTLTNQKTPQPQSGFGTVSRANITRTVAAGKIAIIPPVENSFADSNGNVQVTYTGVTSVTVNPLRLPVLTAR